MAHRVLIPTPLRPFTGQKDAVDVDGGTVGEVLVLADQELRRSSEAPLCRRRQAAAFRERLRERRRHSLPRAGRDEAQGWRCDQHRARRSRVARLWMCPARPRPYPELTNAEIQRYSRHLILPEVGLDGQKAAEGGEACCASAQEGLARQPRCIWPPPASARIGIVDFDAVDASNLQRQILHGTPDVGRSKLQSAKDRLTR